MLVQVGNARLIPATAVQAAALPGAAVSLEVRRGDRQRAFAGEALAAPILVQVRDSLGNPVAGARVIAKVGAGTLADTVLATDSAGFTNARWTLGAKPGEQRIEFWLPERKIRVSAMATARVGPLASVTLRASAPRATGAQRIEAIAVDKHGNPVSGAMLQFTASAGALSVAQGRTDVRGIAAVTWTKPATMRTDARITARVGGTRIAATHVVTAMPAVTRPAARK